MGIRKILRYTQDDSLNIMREGIEKILNSKSKTFLVFCFCFIVGSSIASLICIPAFSAWYLYYICCACIALLIIFFKHKAFRVVMFVILFISLGVLRFVISTPDCTNSTRVCYYNSRAANITGYVSAEPNKKVGASEYYITATRINFDDSSKNISGKIFIKSLPYPEYQFGDQLNIKCNLQSPKELDTGDFRYDKYLARYGAFSVCYNPEIKKVASGQGSAAIQKIYYFKNILNKQLGRLWVEPEGALMAGILYGAKSGLPPNLSESFSKTGTSHIVAVSGYNITIIVVVVMQSLIYLGLYRQKAFNFVVLITILFVVFSGLSASAIRAAVMGLTVLIGKQVGRESRMLNVLVFTVAVMQFGNPFLLFWDVGFQLSFLATVGLVYLSPVVGSLLDDSHSECSEESSKCFKRKILRFLRMTLKIILEPLITTISAIIMTLPLMLYQFGTLSFVAPLVNVLILWLVPYLMLFGAVTVALSFIFFPLANIVAGFTYFGLRYVIIVVEFFGKQSWSSATLNIPLWLMVVMYAVLFVFIIKQNEKSKST